MKRRDFLKNIGIVTAGVSAGFSLKANEYFDLKNKEENKEK